MPPLSNSQAFDRFRHQLPSLLRGMDERFFAQILNEEMRVFTTIRVWAARYAARGHAIAGKLGDTAAAEALIARNRARDAIAPMPPEWPLALQAQIATTLVVTRTGGDPMDVSQPAEPHGFGPSLRALWAEAKRAGLDDAAAWTYIRDWAIRPPALAEPPAITPALAAQLNRELTWSKTDDLDHPWSTTIGTGEICQAWRVRLNDFPEETMYRLEVDGVTLGDFNDWPEAWQRPGTERSARKSTRAVAADPNRWLERYQAGEHEAVWAEMHSLGEEIRKRPHLEPARAVARETMRRARQNVETIIRRLDAMGYQFWDGEQGTLGPQSLRMSFGGQILEFPSPEAAAREALSLDPARIPIEGMRRHVEEARQRLEGLLGAFLQQKEHADAQKRERAQARAKLASHLDDPSVFSPPDSEETGFLRRVEKRGMLLPLSLRAWFEEVGSVNLAGVHPALAFWEDASFPRVHADPLMIALDLFRIELEGWYEEGGEVEPIPALIGWDAPSKARLAVVNEQLDFGYTIDLPNGAADALLIGERHNTSFVNYLRIAFRHGGFAGWDQLPNRPEKELADLADGLLPI